MTQRFAFATAAGLMAFVVVLLGAVGAYIALAGPIGTPASAATGSPPAVSGQGTTGAVPAPPQQAAPQEQENEDDHQQQTTYAVSADNAVNTALASAPGATLVQQPRLVNVNGTVAYEITLDRGYVYVDANSGQVLYNGAAGTRPRSRRTRP